MKKLILFILTLIFINCGSNNHVSENYEITGGTATKYANTITATDLKNHLYIFASDEFVVWSWCFCVDFTYCNLLSIDKKQRKC